MSLVADYDLEAVSYIQVAVGYETRMIAHDSKGKLTLAEMCNSPPVCSAGGFRNSSSSRTVPYDPSVNP